jgi:hypothetical protein
MSDIPLYIRRRLEQRWASRFAQPAINAPKAKSVPVAPAPGTKGKARAADPGERAPEPAASIPIAPPRLQVSSGVSGFGRCLGRPISASAQLRKIANVD